MIRLVDMTYIEHLLAPLYGAVEQLAVSRARRAAVRGAVPAPQRAARQERRHLAHAAAAALRRRRRHCTTLRLLWRKA